MKSSAKKIELASVDDLFSTEEGRQDAKLEKIQEIPLSELHPFKNHPFKVKDDEAMMETADSIKQYGVLVPAIARPDPEGGYELVAGHRRHRASELAEKGTMPVIVRDLDDDAATIIGCFAVYLVAIVWLMIETKYQISIPSPLLLSMIYKLLLPAMPAYLLAKIPSGKLTASLRKMPIPTRIMLVLIVMLRFAPTVLHEFGEVREAMKIRGFLKSVGNVLRHPMDTLEYAIVPMVFRSLKIADELAASAIVRGIESPYKKESYYVSRIAALDYFLIVVSVGAAVCCCLL